MTIKHLVFSGGAYKGFYIVGALDYLIDNKFLKLDEIETIYGTSVGGIIGLALCLKIEMKVLREYIIKKNWSKYFDFSINSVLNILQKKGLLDKTFMVGIFKTLFRKAGININPTFMDIYNHSGINLNIFATNMTTFKLEQFSYKTHPDMMVIDAIYMSSSLPFIFQPEFLKSNCTIDGGLINPYPLNICLNDLKKENPDINSKEILGFKILYDDLEPIKEDSSIFYLGLYLVYKLLDCNYNYQVENTQNYELVIPTKEITFNKLKGLIENEDDRNSLIEEGCDYAKIFMNYLN